MPRHKAASDKQLSRRVLVVVDRDMTAKTPRVIWEHEFPILEAVFGDGKVMHVEPETLDEGYSGKPSPDMLHYNKTQDPIRRPSETAGLGFVFIGDPRAEFDRLCSLYGRHPEVNESMCEHVYGRFQLGRFESVLGGPSLEDLPADQLRSMILSYGYAAEPHADASDSERAKARDIRKAFFAMDHAGLLKLAQEVGVEI